MRDAVLLILRLVLGGLFVFAAVNKLVAPQEFALSVKAFKIFPESAAHLTMLTTFWVPWLELAAGVGVILGAWTRASSLVLSALLATFLAGIVSVLLRDLDVECGCFGKLDPVCKGPLGVCQIVRNAVMLAVALGLAAVGGGRLAADRCLEPRSADA